MTEIQIQTYLSVLEYHSFSKAAEALYVPQPTVSHRIDQLESELNARLLKRSGRSIEPTAAGVIFTPYAMQICDAFRSSKQKIDSLVRGASGTLIIGSCPALMAGVLAPYFTAFLQRYAALSCSLISRCSEDILQALTAGRMDAGVINYKTDDSTLEFSALFNNEVLLVAAPGEGGIPDSISQENLSEKRVLVFPQDRMFRAFLTDELQKRGVVLGNVAEVESVDMIKLMVHEGMGVSFLPEMYVRNELRGGKLKILHPERWKAIYRTTYLCHLQENDSPALRIFCHEIQRQLSHKCV